MKIKNFKYRNKFIKEDVSQKLSFREFAKQVHNKELGFYDLAEFQFEIADWRLNNLNDVSMLLATRGIGKSDIITCLTSLYLIYKSPTKSLIIITDKYAKGQKLLKLMKDIISNSPGVFNDYDISSLLQKEFRTKQNKRKEPSIFIGSLGETLRGIHPDYAVFDDILTIETAWSSTTRENVFEKYEEVKKLTSNILIIGNICHPLDLYSKLRDTDIPKFEIFHNDERIPDWLKPDLDKERLQGVSEANIQANYFGVLLPDESSPFYDLNIVYANQLPQVSTINLDCFYDFSNGGKDYNAVSIGFVFNYELYILGFAMQGMWSEFIGVVNQKIITLQINNVINNIYYESNTGGYEPREKFNQMGYKSVLPIHTSENKRFKISKIYGKFKGIKFISLDNDLHNKKYIELVKNYSPKDNNTIDDAVDSLAMLCLANNWIQ